MTTTSKTPRAAPPRRGLLALLVAPLVAATPAKALQAHKPSPAQVKAAADALAAAMTALHGGKWIVTIDHETRFALIRERFARSSKGAR